jgi:predicted amidophosphoribosyltransferase
MTDDPNVCWYCHAQLRYPGTRCPKCGENNEPMLSDGTPLFPRRKPTRNERLQALADSGVDTREDYRGEK